jgi:putative DNA primase/helicase
LKIGIEAFEPKAWRIGFLNGVWERGQWREHRRDDYLLHVCPVEVDQQSGRDEWYTLLQRMTGNKPEDAELARTLQESVGYTLAGASHLRTLLWAYGPKGTGKSTLAELLQTTLGQQAATIDTKALQDDSSRERLGAAIWGKRLAIVSEAGNKRIDAELLKTLGGGDSLTVRFLYREPFNAAPHHVLLLCANDPPRTDAYDDALRDRVLALPFVHPLAEGGQLILTGGARVEEVRRDPANPLVRGFAAWALEGLARVYRTQTIYRAPAVEAATARFWADADPLTPFWEAISEEELREGITKSALRERYEEWCKQEGMRPVAARTWTRACEAHGLKSDRHKGGTRIWITDKTDKTSPVLY